MTAGLNTFESDGRTFLLVETGGEKIHLVRLAEGNPVSGSKALPAVEEGAWPLNPAYDESALQDTRWSTETICRRSWYWMAPGDAGEVVLGWATRPLHPVHAPTCSDCFGALSNFRWHDAHPNFNRELLARKPRS